MAGRREQVLDAAIAVLGAVGSRGLTYQAVDAEARVPAGTTSNSFRNRAALLRGVLAHMIELDGRDWAAFTNQPPRDIDEVATTLTALARQSLGPGRTRTLARYTLFLESAARPELAELLTAGRQTVLDWGAQWLARLNLAEPRARYRALIGYLDGVILHQLTFPGEPLDPTAGFRAILAA